MTYRVLAELLVEADRLGEAEEILDLLKEQELKDIVRGAAANRIAPEVAAAEAHCGAAEGAERAGGAGEEGAGF